MAWSGSAIFTQWVHTIMFKQATPTTGTGRLDSASGDASVKCALFVDTITPDKNAVLAQTGYNSASSQWLTANEKTAGATEWVAGGRALASRTVTAGTGVETFDAADLTGTETITLAAVGGVLIYDDTIAAGGTVADQGVCYMYFGSSQGVTGGTFSVLFQASGICTITV